jgi:hypothetical protein
MTKSQRLYDEIREFVENDKIAEYDVEFFSKERPSAKFMYTLINKYVNLEEIRYKISDPKAYSHLVDIENKIVFKSYNRTKEINKSRNISRHHDKDFLFKDNKF